MIPLLEPKIPSTAKKYINDCLNTGWLSYTGPYVKKLEDSISEFTGASVACATSNGTGGLWLTLKALKIGPGDLVAVPTMTFVATVNAIIHVGATPVFIDCDDNLQISIECLHRAQQLLNIKAVIPVHLLGNTCDIANINEMFYNKGFVIEDAAQALGSQYTDSMSFVGARTTASIFSFSFNKLIAAGQGGIITTKHEELGNYIKYLSLQAKDNPEMYIHNEAGFNVGMSNINAALAFAQAEQINKILKKKKKIKNKYLDLLGEENIYYQSNSNGWLNAYRSKETYEVVSKRCKEAEVQVRPLFYPNHLQKSFKKYLYFGKNLAEEKYKHTICLPSSTNLLDKDIKKVVQLIK